MLLRVGLVNIMIIVLLLIICHSNNSCLDRLSLCFDSFLLSNRLSLSEYSLDGSIQRIDTLQFLSQVLQVIGSLIRQVIARNIVVSSLPGILQVFCSFYLVLMSILIRHNCRLQDITIGRNCINLTYQLIFLLFRLLVFVSLFDFCLHRTQVCDERGNLIKVILLSLTCSTDHNRIVSNVQQVFLNL